MEKISYLEIIEFNKSLDNVRKLKEVYRLEFKHDIIYLDGERGLFTSLEKIYRFYNIHLSFIQRIKELVTKIQLETSKISPDDIKNGYIQKRVYEEQVLAICSFSDKLEIEIQDFFSRISIYKFYNFTFQPDTLLYNVRFLYLDYIWDFMPNQSRNDIIEGAKGLLVEIPTGSAFLFLRALEGCLRKFCTYIGCTDVDTLMFGNAITYIQKFYDGKDLLKKDKDFIERQIAFLIYIKNEYRNPSAHPEKSFFQNESEQLFQIVNVAIDRIYKLYIMETSSKENLQQLTCQIKASSNQANCVA